jgi:hypothetical protein
VSADPVRAIADAVLYEGYLLWPYGRSALKNQRRWTFGGVHPPAHSRAHPDDASVMRTACLLEAPADATVEVTVRFLHVVHRQVLDAAGRPVDALEVDGERHLTWEEATEREIAGVAGAPLCVAIPAGGAEEPIRGADGRPSGRIVRSWQPVRATLASAVEPVADGVVRVTVECANATPLPADTRAAALARTMCSTHTILRCAEGAFVSMTDPPERLRELAAACANVGTWPVLPGPPGDRSTVLSSPIILEDHPRVAPESPGDLFDGGEIDQLLTLTILSLTEEEREEMRATDPRAREILERTEALTGEELLRLHGRLTDLRGVRER